MTVPRTGGGTSSRQVSVLDTTVPQPICKPNSQFATSLFVRLRTTPAKKRARCQHRRAGGQLLILRRARERASLSSPPQGRQVPQLEPQAPRGRCPRARRGGIRLTSSKDGSPEARRGGALRSAMARIAPPGSASAVRRTASSRSRTRNGSTKGRSTRVSGGPRRCCCGIRTHTTARQFSWSWTV